MLISSLNAGLITSRGGRSSLKETGRWCTSLTSPRKRTIRRRRYGPQLIRMAAAITGFWPKCLIR